MFGHSLFIYINGLWVADMEGDPSADIHRPRSVGAGMLN